MKQLLNQLNDEQVNELARAGRVQFKKFCDNDKFFAEIDNENGDYDLYGNTGSYNLIRRNVREYLGKRKGC